MAEKNLVNIYNEFVNVINNFEKLESEEDQNQLFRMFNTKAFGPVVHSPEIKTAIINQFCISENFRKKAQLSVICISNLLTIWYFDSLELELNKQYTDILSKYFAEHLDDNLLYNNSSIYGMKWGQISRYTATDHIRELINKSNSKSIIDVFVNCLILMYAPKNDYNYLYNLIIPDRFSKNRVKITNTYAAKTLIQSYIVSMSKNLAYIKNFQYYCKNIVDSYPELKNDINKLLLLI